MNRINKEEGDSARHTYIHIEAVTRELMKKYLTHALATDKILDDMSCFGPQILEDYHRLDLISSPYANELKGKSEEEMVELTDVTHYMLDEVVRLTPLTDEESKKRLKVLRDGISNAQYIYRIIGHTLKEVIEMANSENIISSVRNTGEKSVELNLTQILMTAALLKGPHVHGCLVEAAQQIGIPQASMSVIALQLYHEAITKRCRLESKAATTDEEKAYVYLVMFAMALLSHASQSFLDVYKFEGCAISSVLKDVTDDFMNKALSLPQKEE